MAYAVCARMVDLYLEVAAARRTGPGTRRGGASFAPDRSADIQHIYQLKRELVEFKRAVLPLQEPLRALLAAARRPAARAAPWFVDVDARLTRAVDRIAAYDDLLNSILQSRLAQLAVDQNNDMRKIAAWAAIAATQTAIAGVYGMNFDRMPELHWRYGYPAALGADGAAAFTLHRLFRRSGWL